MDATAQQQFATIYNQNYADLRRYVGRRAHPDDVDDIVAETFTISWRRRNDLPAEPRPWLFRTASNVMRNHSRSRKRQLDIAVRTYALGDGRADRDADLDLVAAWRTLRRLDQEVLALHAWEQLPDADAAAVLGCSRATFAMRLTRAKRRLSAILHVSETDVASTAGLNPKESAS
jgi:RNA polymerase sigma factor (sigma-70 family)